MTDERVAEVLLLLARERGAGKSFCPSEAARRLYGAVWRELMPEVRRVAERLRQAGELSVTRRGTPVRADAPGGPIRLSLPT